MLQPLLRAAVILQLAVGAGATLAAQPTEPVTPAPALGDRIGASTSETLQWAATGASSYDVYFGTTVEPPLIATTTQPEYTVSTGGAGTTYYWRVVAKSGSESAHGPLWSFASGPHACYRPRAPRITAPAVADGSTFTLNIEPTSGPETELIVLVSDDPSFSNATTSTYSLPAPSVRVSRVNAYGARVYVKAATRYTGGSSCAPVGCGTTCSVTSVYSDVVAISLRTSAQKVLLPVVVVGQAPGAFGSLFETRLVVTNRGDRPVRVDGLQFACQVGACVAAPLVPQASIFATPYARAGYNWPAVFLSVPTEDLPLIATHLRVQDVSRQSQTWGTSIPTVPESEALSGSVELLDLPVSAEFRTMLRFYDFNPAPGHALRVRIFELSPARTDTSNAAPDKLLLEAVVPLEELQSDVSISLPGFAQRSLESFPELQSASRVRVQVSSDDPTLRFWTFASVTNNATQHITVITPE